MSDQQIYETKFPCPICASTIYKTEYDLDEYHIVRCSKCSLLYNRDFLKQASPENTFSENYYLDVQSDGFAHIFDKKIDDPSKPLYTKGLEYVEANNGIGSVLDVGCAFGSFLKLAKERGWNIEGVELSPYSSERARKDFGFNVHTGDLCSTKVDRNSYDLITFWDVLEHVTNADNQIQRASELISRGGHLALITDNYRSLISYMSSALYYCSFGLLRYPVKKFFIPHNSCYFVKEDIIRLLKKHNFELLHTQGVDHPIDKINLNRLEKIILSTLYTLGNFMGLNSQVLIIAKKKI